MNGIHDMGGLDGMGPVVREDKEPVFHKPWEGRVYGLRRSIGRWGRGRNWGSFRFALESLPPADYLRMSYYERWFTAHVNLLLSRRPGHRGGARQRLRGSGCGGARTATGNSG